MTNTYRSTKSYPPWEQKASQQSCTVGLQEPQDSKTKTSGHSPGPGREPRATAGSVLSSEQETSVENKILWRTMLEGFSGYTQTSYLQHSRLQTSPSSSLSYRGNIQPSFLLNEFIVVNLWKMQKKPQKDSSGQQCCFHAVSVVQQHHPAVKQKNETIHHHDPDLVTIKLRVKTSKQNPQKVFSFPNELHRSFMFCSCVNAEDCVLALVKQGVQLNLFLPSKSSSLQLTSVLDVQNINSQTHRKDHYLWLTTKDS